MSWRVYVVLSWAIGGLAIGLVTAGPVAAREAPGQAPTAHRAAAPAYTAPMTYDTAHFSIHYESSPGSPNVATAAFAKDVGDDAETAYAKEVTGLGWKDPGTTTIYLRNLAADNYGSASAGTLTLDNDYRPQDYPGSTDLTAARQATIAHEFNHVLQFRYGGGQSADQWQAESVATWMEDEVFPSANDYVHFVNAWATCPNIPLTTPNTSMSATDPCRRKVYGAAAFDHWLSAKYGPEVIRRTYEDLSSTGSVAAYSKAIGGGTAGFSSAFAGFAAASAEWRTPAAPFPDRYLDMSRNATTLDPDAASSKSVTLDHTTYTLFDLAQTASPKVALNVRMPAGVSGAVALVGRTGSSTDGGTVTSDLEELPNGGLGTASLDNPGSFGRMTAVMVNSDVDRNGSRWLGDAQPACVLVTTGATADPACAAPASGASAAVSPPSGATAATTVATSSPTPALTFRLAVAARQARAAALRRGIAFTLRCNRRCSARASLALSAAAAKRRRLPRTIGSLRGGLSRAGHRTLRVPLSRAARRRLGTRTTRLVLVVRVTAGSTTRVTRRAITLVGPR